jgi:hypothetical protein
MSEESTGLLPGEVAVVIQRGDVFQVVDGRHRICALKRISAGHENTTIVDCRVLSSTVDEGMCTRIAFGKAANVIFDLTCAAF